MIHLSFYVLSRTRDDVSNRKHVTLYHGFQIQFLAYFPYFQKIKVGLCDLHAFCICVCVCITIYELLNSCTNLYETWYVYCKVCTHC
jgi:hypothetical protein